ncbi:MAG: YhbY family RNA-binding protein [Christensenellaceae bacterium]|jgi:RNA-binding protein|nr:YhbY family RNA-binding protein [Christensenellaceae bacterium]
MEKTQKEVTELSSKQRAYLRGRANEEPVVLHIGKEGIVPNLIKQGWDALEARELIKVQLMKGAPYESAREACGVLCEKLHALPVQCIGKRFVIYRRARKDAKIELP